MKHTKKYFAFISYKREDEEWAKWFQNELENYHFPVSLNGKPEIFEAIPEAFRPPKDLRPVFRDIDELKAGNLPEQIYNALRDSLNLVVICSPRLVDDEEAKWVNKEIKDFIEIGKEEGVDNIKHIFPFIVEGRPHGKGKSGCFPKMLRDLSKEQERIGGNVNEGGEVGEKNRERAFVKVLAGMLPDSVTFDMLWDRYNRDKMERERKEKEDRDRLLIAQSRFVAEKANGIVSEDSYLARLLAVKVLPKNMDNPDRPLAIEAETAIRMAFIRDSTVFRGRFPSFGSISFSNDGSKIAYIGYSDIFIWNVFTGKQLANTHDNPFSLNKTCRGLTRGFANDVVVDAITEKALIVLGEDEQRGEFLAISPNGEMIAYAYSNNSICIYSVSSGEKKALLIGHSENIIYAEFDWKGERLVSCSHDHTVRVWNLKKEEELIVIHNLSFFASISRDGQYIAYPSISNDSIVIRNIESGKELLALKGHNKQVESIVFNDDGKYILSSSKDGTVRLWDTLKGDELQVFNQSSPVESSIISEDNQYIASLLSDGTIRLQAINSNPNGVITKGHDHRVTFVSFSINDKMIVSASEDSTIRIWDASSGKELKTLTGHSLRVSSVSFGKSGNHIISSSWDGSIIIWDCQTWEKDKVLRGHSSIVSSAFFSPTENYVVSASFDHTVRIWRVNSGHLYKVLEGHTDRVLFAVFSPDGRRVVSASADRTIRVWDVKIGKELRKIQGHESQINVVVFNPNGEQIASASNDGTIRIWDLEKGEELKRIEWLSEEIISICYNNDGTRIVASSMKGEICVWDVATGNKVQSFTLNDEIDVRVSFSPDGHRIVFGAGDGTLRVLDFPPLQQLINQTNERFKERPLTTEEKKRYYIE